MSSPVVESQNTAAPPAPASELSTSTLIAAAVTPVATQVATDVATQLHTASLQLISNLEARVTAVEPKVEQALANAGTAVLTRVQTDSWLQRAIVLSIVGAAVLYAGAVLVAYLAGNAEAAKIWGSAPGAILAAVLWVSNSGALPKLGK